jgi:hypothetical protein
VIFDVYGRFQIDVQRQEDAWVAYRVEPGKRTKIDDLIIPPSLEADEIATYLDDVFHELARPGDSVAILS